MCSSIVATTAAAAAPAPPPPPPPLPPMAVDDDDAPRCLSFCWIAKSIWAVSTSSIDVSYSPLLTASSNATPEAIHGVLHLRIPDYLMTIHLMMPKKKEM